MKAGVVIDAWKLPIFERHLKAAGYPYLNAGGLMPQTLLLTVQTESKDALQAVLVAAMKEADATASSQSSDPPAEPPRTSG